MSDYCLTDGTNTNNNLIWIELGVMKNFIINSITGELIGVLINNTNNTSIRNATPDEINSHKRVFDATVGYVIS